MRSRSALSWCAVFAALVAILVLPGGASAEGPFDFEGLMAEGSAKRIFDIDHPGIAVKMSLRGSHGYKIEVESVARGRVRLTARKGDVAAGYSVPGRVTRRSIHANFGRLGLISVRFRRIGEAKEGGRPYGLLKCKGRNPIRERGRFEGTIRFHGEQGFTDVSVAGAKGTVTRLFRRRCGFGGGKREARGAAVSRKDPDSLLATTLIAGNRDHGRTVLFDAVELDAKLENERIFISLIVVGASERRGRVSIQRAAVAEGDPGSILTSPLGVQPVTATVSLPKPFAGTASYLEEPGQPPSWTGSLSVRLPGLDPLPLAGPDFTSALCTGQDVKKLERCVDEAEETVEGLGPADDR